MHQQTLGGTFSAVSKADFCSQIPNPLTGEVRADAGIPQPTGDELLGTSAGREGQHRETSSGRCFPGCFDGGLVTVGMSFGSPFSAVSTPIFASQKILESN